MAAVVDITVKVQTKPALSHRDLGWSTVSLVVDEFRACVLPWSVWPWGVTLSHSDTDNTPECSVEFGAMLVRPTAPNDSIWVRLEFELAGFTSTRPHRDHESFEEVAGYAVIPFSNPSRDQHEIDRKTWLDTGICPTPGVYWSTDSRWLEAERASWAYRQRGGDRREPVHFVIQGRDGFVEIMAADFTWEAFTVAGPVVNGPDRTPHSSGRFVRE